MAKLPENFQNTLNETVDALQSALGENLYSCILYGSAVRGGFDPVSSDINILIILNESTPSAHIMIATAIKSRFKIDPFIIDKPGMARSFEVFALKFLSITQDYEVLHGDDPLEGFQVDQRIERFLCEQALRNIRFRLVHGFVVFRDDRKRYAQFLLQWIPSLFVDLSEVAQLAGREIPHDLADRIPIIERCFGIEGSILGALLDFKEAPHPLSESEITEFHSGMFDLIVQAVEFLEAQWPSLNFD